MNEILANISELADYAIANGLIAPEDRILAVNRMIELLGLAGHVQDQLPAGDTESCRPLAAILKDITDYAVSSGLIEEDTAGMRDLFDTKLMGLITPFPSSVRKKFRELYAEDPVKATDWYYSFSTATNYIRADRIARDIKWTSDTAFGPIDITINLSKPEKDPRDIARAGSAPKSGYPACLLCKENEGYAGTLTHPARQNHRIIPLKLSGQNYYLQYSPYVYYNEHCIIFNEKHIPMKIDSDVFRKLLEFVGQFPHYTVGSNADLPIVGGSILSHDHFQGGRYDFPMSRAAFEKEIVFDGYEDIKAGIIKWYLSVIRLQGENIDRLTELSGKILTCWRSYSDKEAFILAETDGIPHNTITPIARRRGTLYEIDLALRNNITTEDCPLGLYHPHAEYHHIKKENIGLIEVMGLAILPARLKNEMESLAAAILAGKDLRSDPTLAKHAGWAEEFMSRHDITSANIETIIKTEIASVFSKVLECAGVYKCTPEGRTAFDRFIAHVNAAS